MERAAARCAAQALLSARCSGGSSLSSNAAGPSAIPASKAGQASCDRILGHSMIPPSKAHHKAPGHSPWQQLSLLLHGFSQPATEQAFLAYKYQQTRTLDAWAAAYHAAIAFTFVVSFPVTSWLQLHTRLDLLGVVLGWAVPAVVLAMKRTWLSSRGREVAVLLVDVVLAVQAVSIAHGWPAMPPAANARMVKQSSIVDFMLPIIACGVMRAILSQARTRLFALSFGAYMAGCMYVLVRLGVPLQRAVLSYGAVGLVAFVISAVLELQSRATFLQLLASHKGSCHGAGNWADKQRKQKLLKLHDTQGASKVGATHEQQQAGDMPAAKCQKTCAASEGKSTAAAAAPAAAQSPAASTAHTPNTGISAQSSSARAGDTATRDLALAELARLLGPGYQQLLDAAPGAKGTEGGAPEMLLGYQGFCQMYQVGIKVHTEEHAMGSPGFKAMADMLTGAVQEAAGGLTSTGSGCPPCVQATCVQGCVQLLAGISLTPGMQGYGGFGSSSAIRRALEASLQELVRSRLVAMCAQQEVPAFEVTVAPYSGLGSSSGTGGSSSGTGGSSTGSACLLSCSPPCLAAGVGSTELLLDVDVACSVSGSDIGNARLVVWGSSGEVLVDAKQQLAGGRDSIRVFLPTPQEPGLLHMGLLLGSHSLAFVQPVLVLPAAAAEELHAVWAMAAALATDRVHSNCKVQAERQAPGPKPAALAEAWQQLAPLLTDIAYVVGCMAPATAAAAAMDAALPTALPVATSSPSLLGRPAQPDAMFPKFPAARLTQPWLGGEASAAYQELMVHLVSAIHKAGLWATLDFICSTAAASGRIANDMLGQQEQQQQQFQVLEQEERAVVFKAPSGAAQRAAAAVRAEHGASEWAAGIAAVLWYLAALLVQLVQRASSICKREAHAATAVLAAANSSSSACASPSTAAPSLDQPCSLWQQLRTLLTGFKQPGFEQSFLAHKFQQTQMLDACAAAYYGLMGLAANLSYPAAAWLEASTQWGVASFVVTCGLPAVLAPGRMRRQLGPRGRELVALMLDVAFALQAVGIARGLAALPEFMQSKMMATSGFRDEVVVCLGTAVMRTFLGQARFKCFALSFSSYCGALALAATAMGTPWSHAAWRYARVDAVALVLAAAVELHARQAFLKGARARAGDAVPNNKKHL